MRLTHFILSGSSASDRLSLHNCLSSSSKYFSQDVFGSRKTTKAFISYPRLFSEKLPTAAASTTCECFIKTSSTTEREIFSPPLPLTKSLSALPKITVPLFISLLAKSPVINQLSLHKTSRVFSGLRQ